MARLNHQSPLPLYHQLADILQTRIKAGEYTPGMRIPSENELARSYGIGRPTARQAVDQLIRRNLLERRRGSGTFVRDPHEAIDLFSLAGTNAAFRKQGITLSSRIIRPMQLQPAPRCDANPFSGKSAYHLSRLSLVEDDPVLLENIFLHPELFSGIDAFDLSGASLFQIVSGHYYVVPERGRQHFRIELLHAGNAQLMGVPDGTPVLEVKRYLHVPQHENAIYAEMLCRTDRFAFSQTIGGI